MFGSLNHDVKLVTEQRVTVILGANGVGKTQILECLAALFSAHLERLVAVQFELMVVEFDDGRSIRVSQRTSELPRRERLFEEHMTFRAARRIERRTLVRRRLSIQLFASDGSAASEPWEPSSKSEHRRRGELELPPWVEEIDFGYWFDQRSERILSVRDMKVLYGFDETGWDDVPDWFKVTLANTSVRLIETQRLLRTHAKKGQRTPLETRYATAPVIQFAVRDLIGDILGRMQKAIREYARQSSKLDQSYVDRFLDYNASDEALHLLSTRLHDVAERRRNLEELSLLEAETDTKVASRLRPDVTENKKLALSLFAEDMDRKLGILEPLAAEVEMLLSAVNRKLAGSGKVLVTDSVTGLAVRTRDSEQKLDLEHLSSGEQHQVVLLYDLLFRVKEQSLVLIDEPELSLHPAWQQEFVDDIIEISTRKRFDVVLATHSPYILGARTDLCITLTYGASS